MKEYAICVAEVSLMLYLYLKGRTLEGGLTWSGGLIADIM